MKSKHGAFAAILSIACLLSPITAQAQSTLIDRRAAILGTEDEKAVIQTVEDYFWGRQNGDQERLLRGFLDSGDLKGVRPENGQDVVRVTPLSEFRGRLTKPMSVDTKGEILAIDIVDGKLAWVKLTLDSKVNTYTDYLMMYKVNGQWKLVNKMFTDKRK